MRAQLRVPKRFHAATIDTVDKGQFDMVFDYLENLKKNVTEGVGLILAGSNGVGKSWATVALTRAASERFARARLRFDCEFVTAPDLFENMPVFESSTSAKDDRRNSAWVDTYMNVPWLVLNDLGKEYREGQLQQQVAYKLGRLLRSRSEKCLVTHVTTQLDPKQLSATYGESITSLLREMNRAFVVSGPDRRIRKNSDG